MKDWLVQRYSSFTALCVALYVMWIVLPVVCRYLWLWHQVDDELWRRCRVKLREEARRRKRPMLRLAAMRLFQDGWTDAYQRKVR